LADFVLIGFDVLVGIDLLRPQILHDLHGALAEDILLEDIGETGLWIHRKDQHFLALLRKPVGGGGGESGLAQPALTTEHNITTFGMFFEDFLQCHDVSMFE
jgi:hypothetical protein